MCYANSSKEKIKTVSEELEDFVEVSCAVDILKTDVGGGLPMMGAQGGNGTG